MRVAGLPGCQVAAGLQSCSVAELPAPPCNLATQQPGNRWRGGWMFDVHEMEVNFGPQHPSTHGVLRVLLRIDGERIIDAKPFFFYVQRATEKLFENMSYPM